MALEMETTHRIGTVDGASTVEMIVACVEHLPNRHVQWNLMFHLILMVSQPPLLLIHRNVVEYSSSFNWKYI